MSRLSYLRTITTSSCTSQTRCVPALATPGNTISQILTAGSFVKPCTACKTPVVHMVTVFSNDVIRNDLHQTSSMLSTEGLELTSLIHDTANIYEIQIPAPCTRTEPNVLLECAHRILCGGNSLGAALAALCSVFMKGQAPTAKHEYVGVASPVPAPSCHNTWYWFFISCSEL